ncbi:MAG: hypothetical protein LCH95_03020 [Proteobacteria bacterium]|nr:hypothetical protein [Pseudomonadota bacterium]
MILQWRGWGVLVFFVPVVLSLFVLLYFAVADFQQLDGVAATQLLLRLEALALALAAILLGAVFRFRQRTAPGKDALFHVPAGYWVWLVAAAALASAVASSLGLDLGP